MSTITFFAKIDGENKYNIELIETLYKKYQEEGTINYKLTMKITKATNNGVINLCTREVYR